MTDPIAQVKEALTWGDVFWRCVSRGHDRSSAAYEADVWERRAKSQCPAERIGVTCACQDAGITTGGDTCDFAIPAPLSEDEPA